MRLSQYDRSILDGHRGEAARLAMELLVAAAEAMGASDLIDITGAHIDSCLFHGEASLDFAITLASAGGEVAVPSTLNVASLDLLHPDLYRGDPGTADKARRLMDAYVSLGCQPTWTCAPYQLVDRPSLGQQVAWGESNAIVFANSVLGARTERYGDFLDICCALTGRAPNVGLHTDEGRKAALRVTIEVDDQWLDDDLAYVAIGHLLGQTAGTAVAIIDGLDDRADEDRLKSLGAAAASSGAVAMFHVADVTPEATGQNPDRSVVFDEKALLAAIASLGSSQQPLAAVSVGTPHASATELRRLATLTEGRHSQLPFYINTGRDVLDLVPDEAEILAQFGATIVTDTCTYITPIIGELKGAVMTNSGKWAYYAPANLGVDVLMGSLADCVESAVAGKTTTGGVLT